LDQSVPPTDLALRIRRRHLHDGLSPVEGKIGPKGDERPEDGAKHSAGFKCIAQGRRLADVARFEGDDLRLRRLDVIAERVEAILQAADNIKLAKANLALVVGTESMSRNPIAAYTHRGGFRMGEVEFKDFLWESLLDPAPNTTMGGTAENLAKRYGLIP
jgi:hypothetical protein